MKALYVGVKEGFTRVTPRKT